MQNLFIEYVYLVLIILALVMIANKLRLAYPIVLVLGGLALSFTARFSRIAIDPELVFFIFLPPLLYEAAWQISWKEFWKWRRAIISFAFPIVIITSCVIAFVSNALIPGFTLALGLQIDLNFFQQDLKELTYTTENTLTHYQRIYPELLEQQRSLLYEMNRYAEFDEELIRKYLSLIDLEEFKIREKQLQEA